MSEAVVERARGIAPHIGKVIKHRISELPDLTVRAVAERLGMHEQSLYYIFRQADISTETLRKMCDVLEVPMSYFFTTELPEAVEPAVSEVLPENGYKKPATRPVQAVLGSETIGSVKAARKVEQPMGASSHVLTAPTQAAPVALPSIGFPVPPAASAPATRPTPVPQIETVYHERLKDKDLIISLLQEKIARLEAELQLRKP
jgi:transcriptional regulator with XRE-family HTH domain